MKVLSIDVGIKNLAFCLLEKTETSYKIVKWDSINVADTETHICCAVEKNKQCEKPAKFFKKPAIIVSNILKNKICKYQRQSFQPRLSISKSFKNFWSLPISTISNMKNL